MNFKQPVARAAVDGRRIIVSPHNFVCNRNRVSAFRLALTRLQHRAPPVIRPHIFRTNTRRPQLDIHHIWTVVHYQNVSNLLSYK